MTYSEKLRDPRWQKKRLSILDRDDWTCCMCCDNTSELHVHHKVYRPGAAPWEYKNYELTTLCKSCHDAVEELKRLIGEDLEHNFDTYRYLHFLLHCEVFSCIRPIILLLRQHPDFGEEAYILLSEQVKLREARERVSKIEKAIRVEL